MLAFRIFVMLSCLVIVPLAAIFGSAFPDLVKTMLVDRIVAWSTGKSPEPQVAGAAGGFGTVTAGATVQAGAVSEAPRWGQPNFPGIWTADPGNGQSQGVVPAAAAAINPQAGNEPASYAAAVDPQRQVPSIYGQERAAEPSARTGAAEAPAERHPGQPKAGGYVPHDPRLDAPRAAAQPERFTAMERRLREYGATYYLLETWGNEGELYRFHCKMAIGNNPNYTRHFEATDRDALKAMAQVLEKVEMWREGRLQ